MGVLVVTIRTVELHKCRAQSCKEEKRDVQWHACIMYELTFLCKAGQLTIFFLTPV